MKTFLTMIYLSLTVFFILGLQAFAQTLPSDPAAAIDWVKLVGELIANPKALTAAFIGAIVILAVVQAMKSEALGKIFKFIPDQAQFLVITVLGLIYSVLVQALVLKSDKASSVLIGFLSSGGAVAIFNGLKLCFPKFFGSKTTEPAKV